MADFFKNIADQFVFNFIEGDRWRIILDGLLVTLKVTFFAALIGIVLGFLVGLVRATEARGGIRNWRVKSFCRSEEHMSELQSR